MGWVYWSLLFAAFFIVNTFVYPDATPLESAFISSVVVAGAIAANELYRRKIRG